MNLQGTAWSVLVTGSTKKYFATVIISMAIITALPCLAVFSLGSGMLTLLADAPNLQSAVEKGFYTGGTVPGDTYAWGNCTYWVFAMRLRAGAPISTGWGNANTWDDRARRDGYIVDHIPSPGAIYQTDEGDYGHVAFVTTINTTSGDYTISEMNAPHFNVVSERTFKKSSAVRYNFIHQKVGAAL